MSTLRNFKSFFRLLFKLAYKTVSRVFRISVDVSKFIVKVSIAVILILVISSKSDEIHKGFLRSYVGSKVVFLINENPYLLKPNYSISTGTGFHIKSPSGKTYIITNRHVCENYTEQRTYMYGRVSGGIFYKLKIIALDQYNDLCALEPIPNVDAVKISNSLHLKSKIFVLGHPNSLPLTITDGYVIDYKHDSVYEPIDKNLTKEKCLQFKNNSIIALAGKEYCKSDNFIGVTTAVAIPGSSGSPVVTPYGNVIGVMTLSDAGGAFWGMFIPIAKVIRFLEKVEKNE